MINKSVFVTGATGFVGRALCHALVDQSFILRAAIRSSSRGQFDDEVFLDDIQDGCYESLMDGCDAVIHLAARAHILHEEVSDPEQEYMLVNKDLTLNLARSAAKAGINRFIFVSSIGVNGNQTFSKSFSEEDIPQPHDLYAKAKWQAEQGLREISEESGLDIVIIRPTLVYGVGAKGNFQRLLKLVHYQLPLPFAGINNKRSLLGVDNLCDLLICCLQHQSIIGETFLAADGEDISLPDLLKVLATGLNLPNRLWYCPTLILRVLTSLVGKRAEFDKLCGSLQVDIGKARKYLSWHPPVSQKDGLLKMAAAYKETNV